MKLKLLAPFIVDGFDLNGVRPMQQPHAYAAAWDEVASSAMDARRGANLDEAIVESCRFTHGTSFTDHAGSRYRAIDRHSLVRPMHVIELMLRPSAAHLSRWIERACDSVRSGRGADGAIVEEVSGALLSATESSCPGVLIRVFDHGVALLEVDLPVTSIVLSGDVSTGAPSVSSIGARLDALQHVAIEVAEQMADDLHAEVLAPLIDWLRRHEALEDGYVLHRDEHAELASAARTSSRAMWVTRSLVIEKSDVIARVADGSSDARAYRHAIASHWLKDVVGAEDVAQRCCDDATMISTNWLNYFFCEESYEGESPSCEASAMTAPSTSSTVNSGEVSGCAQPFCATWDALLIAQYYYSAFDRLQSKISHILAISVAGEGRRKVSDVKNLLDLAVRDANMLKVEFEENRKYYARRVAEQVDDILNGWDFRDGLQEQIDRRLEDCETRLNEFHARAIERSSIYTDLILLAIGVTAVFEVLLYMAEYGRTMSSDPDMAAYERTSWNVTHWIGGSSTDAILLAGAVFSVGLTLLYAYFRTSKSRV